MSNDSLRLIYDKYKHSYKGEQGYVVLQQMIQEANKLGESACTLFEEHASPFLDPSVTADDLVRIFEDGWEDAPSIRELIEPHLKQYKQILKFRTALTRDCVSPVVSVQYILVCRSQ